MNPITCWMPRSDVASVYSSEYWNDPAKEKTDLWMNGYIQSSGLLSEFSDALAHVQRLNLLSGRVLDVAAGVCWTSAVLSQFDGVESIDALEFSWHRLKMAPHVWATLTVRPEKIRRIFGSFYDIRGGPYDVIVMSQAFHHADEPDKLIAECDAVLKPGGVILMTGEPNISNYIVARRFLVRLLRDRRLLTTFRDLFPPDDVLGDHYYRKAHYRAMLEPGYSVSFPRATLPESITVIARKVTTG